MWLGTMTLASAGTKVKTVGFAVRITAVQRLANYLPSLCLFLQLHNENLLSQRVAMKMK